MADNRPSTVTGAPAAGNAGTKWRDTMLVQTYRLARRGMSRTAIAQSFGVTEKLFRLWWARMPALRDAYRSGSADRPGNKVSGPRDPDAIQSDRPQNVIEYIYGRLPPDLKRVWDKLAEWETLPNCEERVMALLDQQSKHARMHLWVYALVYCNFNKLEACRRVCVPIQTLDSWIKTDPDFAPLVDTIRTMMKDFAEAGLFDLVAERDPGVTMFVNRCINADRGYNPTKTLKLTGRVDHLHDVVDTANLSIAQKRDMLDAMRAQRNLDRPANASHQLPPKTIEGVVNE